MKNRLTTMAVAGLTGLLLLGVMAGWPRAEKVDMTPAQLKKAATHVVTGKVTAIYKRTERKGKWDYSRFCAEVQIAGIEKGDGLSKETPVYVRYWTRAYNGWGSAPPSTNGHRGLPTEGQTLRIYLARNAYDGFDVKKDNSDGGFNVIGANGFEKLPAKAAAKKQ
ncbi:MAG: hypothetical protein ACYTGX_04925 [Planctomycetota bacterium]|jgi:hypothetical protein